MSLTPEERNALFASLSSLVPQKFGQLLFVLNAPQGIVAPPPAPQGDRVFQLLTWAEAPQGCGLSKVQQCLRNVIRPNIFSQTRDPSSLKPFLEILGSDLQVVMRLKPLPAEHYSHV